MTTKSKTKPHSAESKALKILTADFRRLTRIFSGRSGQIETPLICEYLRKAAVEESGFEYCKLETEN